VIVPVVYKITNQINGKSYIGYTKLSADNRWSQHTYDALHNRDNRKFYNAIRKYGLDIWIVESLCTVETIAEAKTKEIEYIALYDSYNKGYNATLGGDGNNGIIMSEESNLKRSKALTGRKKSSETIEKFKSRKQSTETKQAISESHKGMKKPWVKWDHTQIVKRAMTRRALSKEQYDKMHSLRAQGLTIAKISEQIGSSTDLVKKWLKKEWIL
jgi:group I intron endonuclease